MNWDLIFQIGNFAVGIIGVIGGTAGVIFWRAGKKEKEANAQAASIEAKAKEADLVDTILQKFEKAVIGRMDAGEAVRKKEFDQLRTDLGGQLSDIQVENRSQNEVLSALSDIVGDIKEYLNGGFAEFEQRKQSKTTKKKKS